MQVQEVFIKKLKESVSPKVSLVEELADLLKVSTDSAYRRLRNETEFTLKEVHTISKHFNFSVDSLFSFKDDYVTCNYIKLTDSADNFEKYLSGIAKQMKPLPHLANAKVFYAAEEIPIFHSFGAEPLRAFKLFYWQRSVLNVPEYQNKKFTLDIIPKKIMNIAADIHDYYIQIPSVEIWTDKTILTTVKQIEFYYESGAFKEKEDALLILEHMHKTADVLNHWAEKENKNPKAGKQQNFWLYNSDLIIGTNAIYITANNFNLAFITFNTMNSLTTSNQSFCEETDHWMKNLMKKSSLISGTAEKQRFRFFKEMHKHINEAEEKIKNY